MHKTGDTMKVFKDLQKQMVATAPSDLEKVLSHLTLENHRTEGMTAE